MTLSNQLQVNPYAVHGISTAIEDLGSPCASRTSWRRAGESRPRCPGVGEVSSRVTRPAPSARARVKAPRARGGERLKAELRQDTGGAGIPGVGKDERTWPGVRRAFSAWLTCMGLPAVLGVYGILTLWRLIPRPTARPRRRGCGWRYSVIPVGTVAPRLTRRLSLGTWTDRDGETRAGLNLAAWEVRP